jgi:hypothetical protein
LWGRRFRLGLGGRSNHQSPDAPIKDRPWLYGAEAPQSVSHNGNISNAQLGFKKY